MDLQRLRVVVPALQLFEKMFGRSLGGKRRRRGCRNQEGENSHYILDAETARNVYKSHTGSWERPSSILFLFGEIRRHFLVDHIIAEGLERLPVRLERQRALLRGI